jgi:hypothetical protein
MDVPPSRLQPDGCAIDPVGPEGFDGWAVTGDVADAEEAIVSWR